MTGPAAPSVVATGDAGREEAGRQLLPAGRPLAVALARDGRLPAGAGEVACEVGDSGGAALVIGSNAAGAARHLADLVGGSVSVMSAETGPGLHPGALAALLAPLCQASPLVVLPASADGRDLAPRLAAVLDRPLLARAVRVSAEHPGPDGSDWGPGVDVRIRAEVTRLDDQVLVPVTVEGPAVATLVPGARSVAPVCGGTPASANGGGSATATVPLAVDAAGPGTARPPDVEVVDLLPPDPATMDLADADRVLGGGAGLVPPGTDDATARQIFDLLAAVASALGASAGATRVATDAGWIGHDRQIGTTGVAVDPGLYVAFGVSGASQHVGGLGHPEHVISINTDPSCPMTSMARLGVVADALGVLVALAGALGVAVPGAVGRMAGPEGSRAPGGGSPRGGSDEGGRGGSSHG